MRKEEFQSLIEKVKLKSDIVSVIGRRINLDSHNKALCPFHREKTPSFSINCREKYFYCFGCGVGGDVIKFVELFEDIPFREAIYILAEEANIRY